MGIYDRDYYRADGMRPLQPWDNNTMVTMLIVANVIVYIANFVLTGRNNQLAETLALHPEHLSQPLSWYHFLSYGFVHNPGRIWHLIFNMLTLYFLGRHVEDKYGKWEFLRIYLLVLVVCGVVWCLLRWNAGALGSSLIGASGATTAVAMLFVFSFPRETLMLFGAVPVKAWVLGLIIVVGNVFGSRTEVAYDVHLVGAACAAGYFYGNINLGFFGELLQRTRTKLRQKRSGLKVHRGDDPSQSVERAAGKDELEADRLLEKIHRQGKDSLSPREQTFLENYSRKVRAQRR